MSLASTLQAYFRSSKTMWIELLIYKQQHTFLLMQLIFNRHLTWWLKGRITNWASSLELTKITLIICKCGVQEQFLIKNLARLQKLRAHSVLRAAQTLNSKMIEAVVLKTA